MDNLSKLRRRAGYRSAKEFAEKAGISVNSYCRYEAMEREGSIPGIDIERVMLIAGMLDASVGQVLGIEAVPEDLGDVPGMRRVALTEVDASGIRFDAAEVAIEWMDAAGNLICTRRYLRAGDGR